MYKIRGTDEKEYGPVSAEQVRQWIAEGRANSQTFVQGPDSTEWKPLGLFPEFAAAPSTAPGGSPVIPQGGALPAKVPNYLVQAILVTLCCCLPLGIPAIIFAAQVNSKLGAGDMAGALDASRKAKMWCWIAFAVGIPLNILLLIIQISAGAFDGLSRQ